MININKDFSTLIPSLTHDKFSRLEQSIITEGCRDAIVLWGDIIIDGHNRYKICTKHNIPFNTIKKDFASREEAMLWMLQNQLSRRNLSDLARVEMVRKCEEAVRARAKLRQLSGLVQNSTTVLPKLAERGEARDVLAKMTGVGHSTYTQAAIILYKAPDQIIEATRNKELSINAAYQITKLPPEKQTEIAERIKHGENPRLVISQLKQDHEQLPPKRKAGEVIDIWHTKNKYQIIYTSFDWHDWNKRQEFYQSPIEFILDENCILLMWVDYGLIHNAIKTVIRWEFQLHSAAFLSLENSREENRIKSKICLLWTRGRVNIKHEIIETQKLLDFRQNNFKDYSKKMRELISSIYGYKSSIELFSNTPSEGWDVCIPRSSM